jgi:hypothetical protein
MAKDGFRPAGRLRPNPSQAGGLERLNTPTASWPHNKLINDGLIVSSPGLFRP